MSSTEEEQRVIKQTYLREAILEAGYDAGKFVEYLSEMKQDGANIDNWDLDELKIEVQNYKRYYSYEYEPDSPKKQPESNIFVPPEVDQEQEKVDEKTEVENQEKVEEKKELENQEKPEEKKEIEKISFKLVEENKEIGAVTETKKESQTTKPPAETLERKEEIIVNTKKPNKPKVGNLQAKITDTKIINPGIFSYKYEVYLIHTPSAGTTVQRRQTAFNELRDNLVKLYPGYIVPPVPKKLIKRLEPEYINKRMGKLQLFLDDLLRHPLLKASEVVWNFLTIENEKEYERTKRDFEKLGRPKEPSECVTLEGRAKLEIDRPLVQTCKETLVGLREVREEFKNLKKYNAELTSTLNTLANTLENISKSYNRIAEVYGATGGAGLFEVFGTIGEAFGKSTDSCRQLEGMVGENFDKYFRYYRKELVAIEQLLNEWGEGRTQYAKMRKRLKEKKEALFSQKQIDKWEVRENSPYPLEILLKNKDVAFAEMLPNETKDLARYREIYGFYCNKVPEEYQRVCQKNNEQFREHFTKVAKMQSDVFERLNMMWGDMYTHFLAYNEPKIPKTVVRI